MMDRTVSMLRMERQHLLKPANEAEYDMLVRRMSPVRTIYWTEPGAAPVLRYRAGFNDEQHNNRYRAARKLIKGRFQKGAVGYIRFDDLPLYAAVYHRKMVFRNPEEELIFDLVRREGPLNIHLIKEMSGLLSKQITPVLHRLQQSFLLFEDQVDNDWDRSWYYLPDEFSQISLNQYSREEALSELAKRFTYLNVKSDAHMMHSYYGIPVRECEKTLFAMLDSGQLFQQDDGFMLAQDAGLLAEYKTGNQPPSVFLLDRNDFLVRSNEHLLQRKYRGSRESMILYYLLIDGEFCGTVTGRFRFGPDELHDVIPDLPPDEAQARKDEILQAVERLYDLSESPLQHYMGQ